MKSIFVSSTFRDMHFERDILNREIGPRLNYYLSQYNQSIRITDLRWGVDTSDLSEEDATARVLKVCFDEIENCRPHIIILLGDRYGYIPDGESLSVTHMEILKGALENTEREHIYVYFRKGDYTGMPEELRGVFLEQNPAAEEKLADLKALLREKLPDRCREYHASWSEEHQLMISEDFFELLYGDLKREYEKEFSTLQYQSLLEKQIAENEELLLENQKYAFEKTDMLEWETGNIENADRPYAILGDAGAGKSVYLSLLCSHLRKSGKNAHVLFCGDNGFSASVRNAAEYLLYAMSDGAYDYKKYQEYTYEQLLTAIHDQRTHLMGTVYFLLDAVDKCEEGMINFILWCSRYLPEQVKMVCSSRPIQPLKEVSKSFKFSLMEYEKADYRAMAERLLQRHGKALNDQLLEQLVEHTVSPLQLNVLLLRLLNLNASDFDAINQAGGGMDAINAYLQQVIENSSADLPQMIGNLMRTLLEQCPNPEFEMVVLSFIAFSEFGLPESDLEKMVEMSDQNWVQLDYLDLLARFSFFLRMRDNGRVDISHDVIRQTIRDLLEDEGRKIYYAISLFYLATEHLDAFGIRTFMEAIFNGYHRRGLVEFVVRKRNILKDHSGEGLELITEFRKCIRLMFMADNGEYLTSSVEECKNLNEVLWLQAAISGALTTQRDYLSEGMVITMAQVCMMIPMRIEEFPPELAAMELFSVKNFLKRHKIDGPEAENFYAMCQEEIDRRNAAQGKSTKTNRSPEEMMEVVCDPQADQTERTLCLMELTGILREMSNSPKSVDRAEGLLLKLLEAEVSVGMPLVNRADICTSLGQLYKTKEDWEKAIKYDQQSLDIYRDLYEKNNHPEYYRKYRERVYNIANVTEAWAIREKTNQALWQETCRRYEENYRLDLLAVGQGVDEPELMQCAGAILSYGTALINTDRIEEGFRKYQEAVAMIVGLTENRPRPDLFAELCQWMMEGCYQLMSVGKYAEAVDLAKELFVYVGAVANSEDPRAQERLMGYATPFANHLNQFLDGCIQQKEMEHTLLFSNLIADLYLAILPIAPYAYKVNTLHTLRNIADIYYLHLQDYAKAFDAYQRLFKAVEEHELLCPDEQGNLHDEVNLRMGDPFIRRLLCLEKLGRQEELNALVATLAEDAKYIACRTNAYKEDGALLLYLLGMELAKTSRSLGLVTLMSAFHIVSEEGYDKTAHSDTVSKIIMGIKILSVK